MTSQNLENLVRIGKLKAEPPDQREFDGLVASARARLGDARNTTLAVESRFDLAYNAAHALSLAALRWNGYRSDNRYLVFQVLEHTAQLATADWKLLSHCHNRRNAIEYEGSLFEDPRLLSELVQVAGRLLDAVEKLGPVR